MAESPDIIICESASDRRRDVAQRLFASAFKITNTALAKMYGVSQPTITADRKTDAYWDELDSLMDDRMYEVQHKAWEVIKKAVADGNKSISLELLKNTDKRFVRQLKIEAATPHAPADETETEISDIMKSELDNIVLIVDDELSDNGSGNGHKGNGEAETNRPPV